MSELIDLLKAQLDPKLGLNGQLLTAELLDMINDNKEEE